MMLVGWLCLTSHRQQGHLITAPPLNVPCNGREAQFLHCPPKGIELRVVGCFVYSGNTSLYFRAYG